MPRLGQCGTVVSAIPMTPITATRNAPLGISAGSVIRRGTGDSIAEHLMSSVASTAVGFMSGTPRWAGGVPGPGKTKRTSDTWLED